MLARLLQKWGKVEDATVELLEQSLLVMAAM
jgi:hypothetical protein